MSKEKFDIVSALAHRTGFTSKDELEEFVHEVCHIVTLGLDFPYSDLYGDYDFNGLVEVAVEKLSCKEAQDWDEVKVLAVEANVFKEMGVKFSEKDLLESIEKSVNVTNLTTPVIMEQVKFLDGQPKILELSDKFFEVCEQKLKELS